MSSKILRMNHITKSFVQGTQQVTILNNISYQFEQHQSYAITGVSGSGKSTLLHILAGLEIPDRGTIILDGKDILTLPTAQKTELYATDFGVVFQQPFLVQELTVLENVMLKKLIAGFSYQDSIDNSLTLLNNVGLVHKAHEHPATLSGGEQQRVALARALCNKPLFLLADEPTACLDQTTAEQVMDYIIACQQAWGFGLIVCSHDEYVVKRMHHVVHVAHGIIETEKIFYM